MTAQYTEEKVQKRLKGKWFTKDKDAATWPKRKMTKPTEIRESHHRKTQEAKC